MALWYVDTTAAGANNGTSQANAWTNIRSAFEYASYTSGDTIYVRRNQTHTMTDAACAIGDSGTQSAPISIIGDNDTLEIWAADSGDVRPIVDWVTYSRYVAWAGDTHWIVKNLTFTRGESSTCSLYSGGEAWFDNCTFSDGTQTPTYFLDVSAYAVVRATNCAFEGLCLAHINAASGCNVIVSGCTFDDGDNYGLRSYSASVLVENCIFGGTTANDDADITVRGSGRVIARGCDFNSTTDLHASITDTTFDQNAGFIAVEDYGGTKGAWIKLSALTRCVSLAATSTTAGKRAGGADTVIKCSPTDNVGSHRRSLVCEIPINVTAGSKTVDVWTQPDGTWAAVPDVNGADANLYVEVLAWDSATATYLTTDSRNEAQDVQVEGEWHKIRCSSVAADAAGLIIVRVWTHAYEAGNFFHVDRVVDVA